MTNPDPQVTDTQPEVEYAPPAPAQSEAVATELEGGGFLVSYIKEGRRYAATGATEEDARKLLDEQPELCLIPRT